MTQLSLARSGAIPPAGLRLSLQSRNSTPDVHSQNLAQSNEANYKTHFTDFDTVKGLLEGEWATLKLIFIVIYHVILSSRLCLAKDFRLVSGPERLEQRRD
jgi:hypothetical protein